MRWHGVAAMLVGSVAMIVAACGSEQGAAIGENPGGASSSSGGASSSGTFVPAGDAGQPPSTCKPKTCADVNANCGPIGDGCGGVVECGTCAADQTCGGGGTPSTCGKPPCTPKTCADLGAECGPAGDGCGGVITSCGTCDAGICGGGGPSKCGTGGGNTDGGVCVPTKTACAPGDCGPIADGCGGLLNCSPTCPVGQTCGGGNVPSLCGAPPCTKATCDATANCGYKADGCGGILTCWPAGVSSCPPGQTCGGAGSSNQCGTPPGCTGLCLQQQGCAGGATTSIEGYVTSPNGKLPIPNAVVYVPNGAVAAFTAGVKCESCATASGNPLITTTTDANGHFLLPNMPVSTPGKVVDIPVVVQLGRWRKQLTIQTTACQNNKVPAYGAAAVNKTAALPSTKTEGDIPLTAISTGYVDALECVFRKIGVADTEFTHGTGNGRIRLFPDEGSGDGQGGACASGCGTDCANKGNATCPEASKLYQPSLIAGTDGGVSGATNATPIEITTSSNHNLATGAQVIITNVSGNTAANGAWTITKTSNTKFTLNGSVGNGAYSSSSTDHWFACNGNCGAEIEKYDAVIFGCVGGESNKPIEGRQNVINYANKGGRVFATHFSYVWLYSDTGGAFKSPWSATANQFDHANAVDWNSTNPPPGSISAFLDTSFPKGVLFSNWLQAPVGTPSATYPPPYAAVNGLYQVSPPQIALSEPRSDITPTAPNLATSGIVSPAQRWIYTTTSSTVFDPGEDPAARNAPMHYTFNTPWSAPAANQCGRVLFSDFHVSLAGNGNGGTNDVVFPNECDNNPLTAQEKVLAYMLFDLASCVSTSGPPACVPKDCPSQGIGCGPAGDGCGNVIQCGNCPNGQTCGGGGVPNQCGAPACTPIACVAGECGLKGNGCGGQLDCGNCQTGQVCGAGGPNQCGVGACVPAVCPTPAAGSSCGPVANGCGGLNNCPCPSNVPCVNGKCGTPPCTPRTCQQAGANCGQVADGCGGIQDCGNCVAPQTCGGGGIANICGGGVN